MKRPAYRAIGRGIMAAAFLTMVSPTFADAESRSFLVEEVFDSPGFVEIISLMERYFPDDAAALRRAVHERALAVGVDRSERYSVEQIDAVIGAISDGFAAFYLLRLDDLYNAPTPDLMGVLQAHIQIIKFYEGRGNDCNVYILYGGGSSLIQSQLPGDLQVAAAETKFRAISAGASARHARARLETFPSSLQAQIFARMSRDEIAMLNSPDINNPATCTANLKFLENATRASGEGAAQFRAEIAVSLVEAAF